MKAKQFLIFLAILKLPALGLAADNSLSFRVGLFVSADESIKGRIESYLSRELRALGDVTQSKDNYEYDMTVVALKTQSKGGYETGVVLSVTIHQKFENEYLSSFFKEENKKAGIEWTNGLYFYPEHWVRVGANEDLKSICSGIIADFDSQTLQKRRDSYQKLIDTINKNKDSANK
jgi:hypothetical protein